MESVTLKRIGFEKPTANVTPVIVPVAASNDKPAGRRFAEAGEIDQAYSGEPPVATKALDAGKPAVHDGSDVVVIAKLEALATNSSDFVGE